jgi:hypothetical protein
MWCDCCNLEAYGEVPKSPAVEDSIEKEKVEFVMRDAIAFCMRTSSGWSMRSY